MAFRVQKGDFSIAEEVEARRHAIFPRPGENDGANGVLARQIRWNVEGLKARIANRREFFRCGDEFCLGKIGQTADMIEVTVGRDDRLHLRTLESHILKLSDDGVLVAGIKAKNFMCEGRQRPVRRESRHFAETSIDEDDVVIVSNADGNSA